jgi:hypothetical protein
MCRRAWRCGPATAFTHLYVLFLRMVGCKQAQVRVYEVLIKSNQSRRLGGMKLGERCSQLYVCVYRPCCTESYGELTVMVDHEVRRLACHRDGCVCMHARVSPLTRFICLLLLGCDTAVCPVCASRLPTTAVTTTRAPTLRTNSLRTGAST